MHYNKVHLPIIMYNNDNLNICCKRIMTNIITNFCYYYHCVYSSTSCLKKINKIIFYLPNSIKTITLETNMFKYFKNIPNKCKIFKFSDFIKIDIPNKIKFPKNTIFIADKCNSNFNNGSLYSDIKKILKIKTSKTFITFNAYYNEIPLSKKKYKCNIMSNNTNYYINIVTKSEYTCNKLENMLDKKCNKNGKHYELILDLNEINICKLRNIYKYL